MISLCPFCQKALNLNDVQKEKIGQALAQLKPGTSLKLGCPHCRKPIMLGSDGEAAAGPAAMEPAAPSRASRGPQPPDYPDISWLASGIYENREVIEDIPQVLILVEDAATRNLVQKAFETLGYQADSAESAEDAIAKMRFIAFSAVVLHSGFDGSLESSHFHASMQAMPMGRRRGIYYVLVGPEFHTLYDLEALTHSANVVVNESEIPHIEIILKKGLRDYEELFGPYLRALREAGQK